MKFARNNSKSQFKDDKTSGSLGCRGRGKEIVILKKNLNVRAQVNKNNRLTHRKQNKNLP